MESRKEKNRRRNIEDILDATARLIAVKGIQGVSVDEIAKEADFGKGTLYNYFKNKDDIIMSLVEKVFGSFVEEISEKIDSDLSVKEKIRIVIAIAFTYFEKQVALNEILAFLEYSSWQTQQTSIAQCACDFFDTFHKPFIAMFEEGIKKGELRSEQDPAMLSYAFFSLFSTVKKCKLREPGLMPDDQMQEFILNTFFEKL